MTPQPGDIVIPKTRYSGFFNTNIDSVLRSRGIRTLVFTGVATNVCVESSLRDAFHQARNVGHIADRLQILVPIEFFDQRDHVDWARRFRQIHHARIDPAMRVEREILDPQMFGGLVVGKVIQQNRAQNRAFRLDVRRKCTDRVFGSGQGPCSQEKFRSGVMNINSEPLVNAKCALWKTQSQSKIVWYEKMVG